MFGDLQRLTPGQRIEFVALLAGLKPVIRWPRPSRRLLDICTSFGLTALELRLAASAETTRGGECFLSYGPVNANSRTAHIHYVARDAEVARHCIDVEIHNRDDKEIGSCLGIPDCCVAAYNGLSQAPDWLDAMLDASPRDQGFAACNRIGRQLGSPPLLPDYFPCSFACKPSAQWAEQIDAAMRDAGFDLQSSAAWRLNALPLRIDAAAIVRTDGAWIARSGRLREPRYLTWTRL